MTSCVHKMWESTYGHFIHIWYLDWPWFEHVHILPISRMVDFCESYSPFHVCLTICPFAHLVYATSHLSFSHFICDKRKMTSCVHKMCEQTYGQTNMKRAITLAKINQPWNRYNMHMLKSWPIKIPNMNKMRKRQMTQLVIFLLSHFIHIWFLDWPWSEHAHIIPISRMVDFCESYSPFHVCLTIRPFAHFGKNQPPVKLE
jgi:hypothetical protein